MFHFETATKRAVRYVLTVLQKCIKRHVFRMSLGLLLSTYLSDVSDSKNIRHRRGFVSGYDYLPRFFVDLHANLLQIEGLGLRSSA